MKNTVQTVSPAVAVAYDADETHHHGAVQQGHVRDAKQGVDTSKDALEQVLVRLARSASLEHLVPEIRSAVNKARQHDRATGLNQALSMVADQGGLPFVLLSAGGELCFASPVAKALIARETVVDIHEHRFILNNAAADEQLHLVLARHVAAGSDDVDAAGGVIRVPRETGRAHMQLLLRPLWAGAVTGQAGVEYTAVFLHDPDAAFEVDSFQLAVLFDLSYAEARVTAYLAAGSSLAAIAEDFHLSIHTVRTELKSVFRKTGASSQAELIRAILTSPACRFGTASLL